MNDDWRPVALDDALDPGQVLAVPLDGREHVMWRDAAGALHAHDDRCPHRGMRLSYGFVREGRLVCPYHGWQFDPAGQCRALPAHPGLTPATTMRVRTHAVASGDGLIWLRNATAASPADVTPANPPRAGWPSGLAVAPVRSRYLTGPVAEVGRAVANGVNPLLGAAMAERPAHPDTGYALLPGGDRGLGWGLHATGDGRTGVHVVALARGGVDAAWRLAVSRALRVLTLSA